MLTKRTNILFSQETWNLLTRISRQKNKSVGELVRHAVKKNYAVQKNKAMTAISPLEELRQTAKKLRVKPLTIKQIKQYINEGRHF